MFCNGLSKGFYYLAVPLFFVSPPSLPAGRYVFSRERCIFTAVVVTESVRWKPFKPEKGPALSWSKRERTSRASLRAESWPGTLANNAGMVNFFPEPGGQIPPDQYPCSREKCTRSTLLPKVPGHDGGGGLPWRSVRVCSGFKRGLHCIKASIEHAL